MKKSIIIIIILVSFMVGCGNSSIDKSQEDKNRINIIVSIEPQKTFVEKVTENLVDIKVVIPQGYSPANYQPSPREIQDISNGDAYFSIGVESEKAFIIPKLKDFNEDMELIDLQKKVKEKHELLYIEEEHNDDHDHDEGDIDPHIWLSPKRVITIVEAVRDYMVEIDSDNKSKYTDNAQEYINELEKLDRDLINTFKELDTKAFIIYHPAFSYFAKDYGLEMITIEEAGKEATAIRIQNVVDFAKANDIKVVFYQDEFDSSQAKIIADEIDGEAVEVNPLSGDYINNMYEIRDKFAQVLK
ncbi:MAG: zinc ABC transporter substrate-binding protein [Bacillota bacterium]|nr:zinc ABC transporter substrate-binding protein [Bacillota bacterium]